MREEWSDFPGLFPKEDHLEADKVGKSRAPGPECHTPVTGHYSSVCESLDMPNKTLGGSGSPSDIIVVGPPACRAPRMSGTRCHPARKAAVQSGIRHDILVWDKHRLFWLQDRRSVNDTSLTY